MTMLTVYILTALAVSLVLASPFGQEECQTQHCAKTAAEMKANLNMNVDPCDDFYEYACGNWIKNHPPTVKGAEYAVLFQLREQTNSRLITLLSEDYIPGEVSAVRKAKQLFKSCMDVEEIERKGVAPLMAVLNKIGGWPVISDNWSESSFDIGKAALTLSKMGFNPLFDSGVREYIKHGNDMHGLFIDQPTMHLTKSQMVNNNKFMSLYRVFAKKIAHKLNPNARNVDRQIDDMINFAYGLAQISETYAARKSGSTWSFTMMSDFTRRWFTFFPMDTYLNGLLEFAGAPGRVDLNTGVNNFGLPTFWVSLNSMLSYTNKKTIANYMAFDVVYHTMMNLPPREFDAIVHEFIDPIWNYGPMERSMVCYNSIIYDPSMGNVTSRMFVDRYFTAEAKATASDMVEQIRRTFERVLAKVPWMDQNARNAGVAKAEAIQKDVGYAEGLKDDNKLNREYEHLETTNDGFYNNFLSSIRFKRIKTLAFYGKKPTVYRWGILPTVVNAFYHPLFNHIYIPAAILQAPFYHKDNPKFLNFAGVGFIIGHELGHGFDTVGKEYDLHGNAREWWSERTIQIYNQKASCYARQYSSFFVPEVRRYVNGALTLNENIADNGGLLEAYKAYRNYVKERGSEEPTLPGMQMTNDQLFFLNVAQTWCDKVYTKADWDYDLKEKHSPMRYRILGVMKNSEDFHRTYKCSKGSNMNPSTQCRIW